MTGVLVQPEFALLEKENGLLVRHNPNTLTHTIGTLFGGYLFTH